MGVPDNGAFLLLFTRRIQPSQYRSAKASKMLRKHHDRRQFSFTKVFCLTLAAVATFLLQQHQISKLDTVRAPNISSLHLKDDLILPTHPYRADPLRTGILPSVSVKSEVPATRVKKERDVLSMRNGSTNNAGRLLPSFQAGGVMVFLHYPKTGGTTLNGLKDLPKVQWLRINDFTSWNQYWPLIQAHLSLPAENRSTLFLEFHNYCPKLENFFPMMNELRQAADEKGVSTFVFTLIRDPIDFALSFFHFFYTQPCSVFKRCTPQEERSHVWVSATEKHLRKLSPTNYQCLLLAYDMRNLWHLKNESATSNRTWNGQVDRRRVVNTEECFRTFPLLSVFDWIGTTDLLSEETLPLLTHMLTGNATLGTLLPKINAASPSKLSRTSLTSETLQYLRNINSLDLRLYEYVQRNFQFESQWDNLPASIQRIRGDSLQVS